MKVLNELHLPTAKIIVARKSTKSLADLSKYRSGIEDSGLAFKDILYVDLEASNKSELREAYQQLIDLCRTQGIYTVIDDSHTMRGKQFIKGMIFSDIFGKDSSLWKNLGVYYHDDIKWICGTRWESAKRECESRELVDSEFKIDSSKLNIVKIDSLSELKKIVPKLAKSKRLYGDIETSTLRFEEKDAKILTIQWTTEEDPLTSYVLMYDHPKVPVTQDYKLFVKDLHQKILTKKQVVFHNGFAFDLKFLCRFFEVDPLDIDLEDTYVMHRIVTNSTASVGERRESSGLKALAFRMIGDWDSNLGIIKADIVKEHKLKLSEFDYSMFPVDMLVEYAGYDTIALREVYFYVLELNEQHPLKPFKKAWYGDFESEYTFVGWKEIAINTTKLMMNGIPLNMEKAKKKSIELKEKLKELDDEIKLHPSIKEVETKLSEIAYSKAVEQYNQKVIEARKKGKEFKGQKPCLEKEKYGSLILKPEFNPGSNEHLLFDILGLKPISFTDKGQPQANKETFEQLTKEHSDISILKLFGERSHYEKELGSFVDPWIKYATNAYDGRIHTTFSPDTTSFRFSSKEPNVQQIPKQSDIKGLFESEGKIIMSQDYSALEVRANINLCKDEFLVKSFNLGIDDEHSQNLIIASKISDKFKLDKDYDPMNPEHLEEVSGKFKSLRRDIKSAITFPMQFLASPMAVKMYLNCSDEEADKLYNSWWDTRAGYKQAIEDWYQEFKNVGYTEIFGGLPLRAEQTEQIQHIDSFFDLMQELSKATKQRDEVTKKELKAAVKSFRTFVNAKAQSSVYLTHRAMCLLNRKYKEEGKDAKIINSIHDDLHTEGRVEDLMFIYDAMKEAMEEPYEKDAPVPMATEAEVGRTGKFELGVFEKPEQKEKILRELSSN